MPNANIFEFIDEWNDAPTTFNAIKVDVTDTASAAASKLIDLQIGSASKFAVRKDGRLNVTGEIAVGGLTALNLATVGSAVNYPNLVPAATGNPIELQAAGTDAVVGILARPKGTGAAFEIRNGTTAQSLIISNSYTDASNYQRGFMRFDSNILKIGMENAGTGESTNIPLYLIGEHLGTVVRLGVLQVGYSPSTCLGMNAGAALNTADTYKNTYIGSRAGVSTITSNSNTGIGYGALGSIVSGSNENTAVGEGTFNNAASTLRSVALGYYAGQYATGGNNLFLGYKAGDATTTGANNVVIGYNIDTSGATASNELNIGNIFKGDLTTGLPALNLASTASAVNYLNVVPSATGNPIELQAAGTDAVVNILARPKGADAAFEIRNSTVSQRLRIFNTHTDASNYERGYIRWDSNWFEFGTDAAGTGLARSIKFKNGIYNTGRIEGNSISSTVALGYRAGELLPDNTTRNVYIGGSAGQSQTANSYNVGIGSEALKSLVSFEKNTGVGAWALRAQTERESTALGALAGQLSVGRGNIFVGFQAASSHVSGGYNIIMGYNLQTTSTTQTYQLKIGGVIQGDLTTGLLALNLEQVASSVGYISILPAATGNPPQIKAVSTDTNADLQLTPQAAGNVRFSSGYGGLELSADPADPAEGRHVIWQSDGTGAGDDGDLMIKITAGAVTKTATLVDHSAV